MKKQVIVVIATKNRLGLFRRAFESIVKQTRKPNEIIVISDSIEESQAQELDFIKSYGCTFLTDRYEHNYAGSLNTALDYLIKKSYIEKKFSADDTFVAFLDDDDYWEPEYIERCLMVVDDDTDFVVSGLNYQTEDKSFKLSIPEQLDSQSFLAKNPHLQGSNTFVRLSLILLAGCFDENMSSTTDRDFFTRLMMIKPRYKVLKEWLVNIDAGNGRDRLTLNTNGKQESLSKFYSKYGGMMDDATKEAFFERANSYTQLNEFIVKSKLECDMTSSTTPLISSSCFDRRIIYSFIVGSVDLYRRLIDDISCQRYKNIKVVVLLNFDANKDDCLSLARRAGIIDIVLYKITDVIEFICANPLYDYLKNSFSENKITDIASARIVLNLLIKENLHEKDVVLIIDDDIDFLEITALDNAFIENKVEIADWCGYFSNQYDAVIGSYSGQPPLPLFSTLRCSLLDYVYKNNLNKNKIFDKSIFKLDDYYYDLTQATHRHLETPQECKGNSLDDVFNNVECSRPLFRHDLKTYVPKSRGGVTIIYNHELLDIPNISISFGDVKARRSDYFWTELALEKGYSIVCTSLSLKHNRPPVKFDYLIERDKSIKDLIGSSFTKAYSKGISRTDFLRKFKDEYIDRLIRFISSYVRIMGLLKIADADNDYGFNRNNLFDYIRKSTFYLDDVKIEAAFNLLTNNVRKYDAFIHIDNLKGLLEKTFNHSMSFLGCGLEGAVFCDSHYTYKLFFNRFDESNLIVLSNASKECPEIESLDFVDIDEYQCVRYKNLENTAPYVSGHADEIVDLLIKLKRCDLVLTNIKKENFILSNEHLKFIDYGRNVEKFTLDKWHMSIERAYEMLRYPDIGEYEFNELITLSHKGKSINACFGIDNFIKLLSSREKEAIHDKLIVEEITRLNPSTLLDYGAGKCKIANSLSNRVKVSVFDIDLDTIKKRANNDIKIIDDIEKSDERFDVIISNLVLCCTDNKTNDFIIKQIHSHLKDEGYAIISFCNPFFDDIEHTETRKSGRKGAYGCLMAYTKDTKYGPRNEFHRPLSYYENLFRRNGFKIEKVVQDDGVCIDNLETISEHAIFVLERVEEIELNDCSLLIKCNAMEAKTIKFNVLHIVNQLEYGCRFAEKVVVVDGYCENRSRAYSIDDEATLRNELNDLLQLGIIDRIVWCNNDEGFEIYSKWFGSTTKNAYSQNGQQLLSSLKGFEAINTRYVFQTDSDILYSNKDGMFADFFEQFKQSQAMTASLSIYHDNNGRPISNNRVEVRSCFLDLVKVRTKLPLVNQIENGTFKLPWHRALDQMLGEKESVRFSSNGCYFVHPQNEIKKKPNYVLSICNLLESGANPPDCQCNNVDLTGSLSSWMKMPSSKMAIFIRGQNTPIYKLHRLFLSLKNQEMKDFSIVYVDDDSREEVREFARAVFKYDEFFKERTIAIFNNAHVDESFNFDFVIHNIITDPYSIIVNVDSDDCLLTNDALSIIRREFDNGADVTVGNCLREDKPTRHYQVDKFEESWWRDGDNIWLHPKCFRRYLCSYIQNDLFLGDGYVKVCTDYAIMLPIVEHAKKPVFIDKQIYYFEPSFLNKSKSGKYSNNERGKVMKTLLERAKKNHARKTIAVIGDGFISENDIKYKLAYELGKALVDSGYKIQTGGLGGVMEAVFRGAHDSLKYQKGDTIAILPSLNPDEANEYADVVIPTGLDVMRNAKVVDADAVIAIGGGAGTLSEMAIAWQLYKLIIAFSNAPGWSAKLADKKLDERIRYGNISEDLVYGVTTIDECMNVLNEKINKYTKKHTAIKWRKK